jgi:protocatechuate 3,4-dioxygenase beta subunit
MRAILLQAFIPLIAAVSLSAQASFTGTLLGTVTDPTGATIDGASVAITNLATNEVSRHKTDAAGNYYVPNLKPGDYSITIEAPGFKKFARTAFLSRSTSAPGLTLR